MSALPRPLPVSGNSHGEMLLGYGYGYSYFRLYLAGGSIREGAADWSLIVNGPQQAANYDRNLENVQIEQKFATIKREQIYMKNLSLPARLPARPPARLPARLPACPPACPHARLPARLPAWLPLPSPYQADPL